MTAWISPQGPNLAHLQQLSAVDQCGQCRGTIKMYGRLGNCTLLFLPWKNETEVLLMSVNSAHVHVIPNGLQLFFIFFPFIGEHSSEMVTSELKKETMCVHELPLYIEFNVPSFLLWIKTKLRFVLSIKSYDIIGVMGTEKYHTASTLSSKFSFIIKLSFSIKGCARWKVRGSSIIGESRDVKTSAMVVNFVGKGFANLCPYAEPQKYTLPLAVLQTLTLEPRVAPMAATFCTLTNTGWMILLSEPPVATKFSTSNKSRGILRLSGPCRPQQYSSRLFDRANTWVFPAAI